MNTKVYHWVDEEGSNPVAGWFAAFQGVFFQDGPATLGPAPAFGIWSGSATMASSSSCRQAALSRMRCPTGDRLLDHLALRYILTGAMRVGEDASAEVAQAGDGFLIDLSQPLRLEYAAMNDNTTELTLWISRAGPRFGLTDPSALHGRIFRSGDAGVSVINAAVRALRVSLNELSADELDRLIGGLFGFTLSLLRASEALNQEPAELESFTTICRYIEANLAARDLGVERLTRTFGLSRASLYRLFEPVGGVASYVRARRLRRARQELQAVGLDNRRIGPIAYQSGFSSVTAFNRAFREAYGQTPREARRSRFNTSELTIPDADDMGILGRSLLAMTR